MNSNHPDVILLRKYRDSVLKGTAFGRFLIDVYYFVGPVLAVPVRNWRPLRIWVKGCLVQPIVHRIRSSGKVD